MNKIVDYTVLDAVTQMGIESKVREYLRKGWVPLGGICVDTRNTTRTLFQAVVKYEDQPSDQDT